MFLAELSRSRNERLCNSGNRRIFLLQAERSFQQTTLSYRCARRDCPVMNEARPAVKLCSGIIVGEHRAFTGDPSILGRLIAIMRASRR